MSWAVDVRQTDGKWRLSLAPSEYDADMHHLLPAEAERFANQLLIKAAECKRLNNPPKKFYQ